MGLQSKYGTSQASGGSPSASGILFTAFRAIAVGGVFAAAAGEKITVDLAAAGGSSVTIDLPAAATPGQAISISVSATGPGSVIPGANNGDWVFGLQFQDELVLVVWSGARWVLVGKYLDPPPDDWSTTTFQESDLDGGGNINIPHGLANNFLIPALWDDAGNLVIPGAGTWSLTRVDADNVTLTIAGALRPISGSWGISLTR